MGEREKVSDHPPILPILPLPILHVNEWGERKRIFDHPLKISPPFLPISASYLLGIEISYFSPNYLIFLAFLELEIQTSCCHRAPSVCLSISDFDFSGQTAGPIRLKFGSNVLLLTGSWDCKARSSHVT